MLEERETELKELEQLQTLQTTDYIDALVNDTAVAAPSKVEALKSESKKSKNDTSESKKNSEAEPGQQSSSGN